LTPHIQDKSRMREIRSYGSVRGALGDQSPYRDSRLVRPQGANTPIITTSNENDLSVTARVSFGDFRAEIGGELSGDDSDNYKDIETGLAKNVGRLDVYKVHHHCSSQSSNDEWLRATKPTVAISDGDTRFNMGRNKTPTRSHRPMAPQEERFRPLPRILNTRGARPQSITILPTVYTLRTFNRAIFKPAARRRSARLYIRTALSPIPPSRRRRPRIGHIVERRIIQKRSVLDSSRLRRNYLPIAYAGRPHIVRRGHVESSNARSENKHPGQPWPRAL
jgi:hypothetical protein